MSTASSDASRLKHLRSDRPLRDVADEISQRKAKHLEICVDESTYSVETADARFSGVKFLHRSLPEIDERSITTRMRFLNHDISLPLLISCMTGGSAEGNPVNRRFAEAAERANIPVGMGSIRILFSDDAYFEHFHIKPFARDVPVIANLSAVQIRDLEQSRIIEILKRLEVQALAIHLNTGQELFQPKGDRDFRGLKEAIAHICQYSPIPIIVKETGFGIRPSEVDFLLDSGAASVDLAGAGGTNWVRVESYRIPEAEACIAREFDDWGIPTALLLAALRTRSGSSKADRYKGKLIASGGLRSGADVAKALALGADLAGIALPFARAVSSGGVDGILEAIGKIEKSLRFVMALTGSATLEELRSQRLLFEPGFSASLTALIAADADATAGTDA